MNLKDQKGQTVVEYILLIAVITAIIGAFASRIKDYYLSEDCGANSLNPLCLVKLQMLSDTKFKYFRIIK